jgi:penicillin-binding protein 2
MVKDNNTWFICFAPYETPKVAAAILVQGGYSGGSTSAPVAKRVIEQSIAVMDGSYKVDLATIAKLTEAKGNFTPLEAISYGDKSNVPQRHPEDDAEVIDDDPPEPIAKGKAVPLTQASLTEAPTLESQGSVNAPRAKVVDDEDEQYKTKRGVH